MANADFRVKLDPEALRAIRDLGVKLDAVTAAIKQLGDKGGETVEVTFGDDGPPATTRLMEPVKDRVFTKEEVAKLGGEFLHRMSETPPPEGDHLLENADHVGEDTE